MKKYVLTVLSLTLFVSLAHADFPGYRKASATEKENVYEAIVIANGNSTTYGKCDLSGIPTERVALYLNQQSDQPLVMTYSQDPSSGNEIIGRITTDAKTTKLVSVTIENVTYSTEKVNKGTIDKPIIVEQKTSHSDVQNCDASGDTQNLK